MAEISTNIHILFSQLSIAYEGGPWKQNEPPFKSTVDSPALLPKVASCYRKAEGWGWPPASAAELVDMAHSSVVHWKDAIYGVSSPTVKCFKMGEFQFCWCYLFLWKEKDWAQKHISNWSAAKEKSVSRLKANNLFICVHSLLPGKGGCLGSEGWLALALEREEASAWASDQCPRANRTHYLSGRGGWTLFKANGNAGTGHCTNITWFFFQRNVIWDQIHSEQEILH